MKPVNDMTNFGLFKFALKHIAVASIPYVRDFLFFTLIFAIDVYVVKYIWEWIARTYSANNPQYGFYRFLGVVIPTGFFIAVYKIKNIYLSIVEYGKTLIEKSTEQL